MYSRLSSSVIYLGGRLISSNLTRAVTVMANNYSTTNLNVEHDPKNKKFYIKLGNAEAKLEYVKHKLSGKEVLNMWHTEVPPQLQGQGIAKVLAEAAFNYVVENDLKMQLSCSYLQKYYADNPLDKYKAVLSDR